MFASGNKITKHWQFKGKHTGNFFGIPATNKDVDLIGCTIATIVNGKITEEQDFFDNLTFLQQLGLMAK
jgi:predicted ester cyclase